MTALARVTRAAVVDFHMGTRETKNARQLSNFLVDAWRGADEATTTSLLRIPALMTLSLGRVLYRGLLRSGRRIDAQIQRHGTVDVFPEVRPRPPPLPAVRHVSR